MIYVWMAVYTLGSGLLYYYIVLPGLTKMFEGSVGGSVDAEAVNSTSNEDPQNAPQVRLGHAALTAVALGSFYKFILPRFVKPF